MFWHKKPHRLYIPTKSHWYTRPRYRPGLASGRQLQKTSLGKVLMGFLENRFRWLATMFFLLCLTGILGVSSYFTIKNIQVGRGNFNVNTATIENELNRYIGKNIFFFSKRVIAKTIRDKFPEFESVAINRILPSTIKITLINYPIVANLKAYYVLPEAKEAAEKENEKLNADQAFKLKPLPKKEPAPIEQKCLLNSIGQAIFDQEENLELMTIAVRELTQPVEDREFVLAAEQMQYISSALQYFSTSLGLPVEGMEYLPVAREMRIQTKNHMFLWLTLEKDYKEQLDKLKTIYEPAELDKENLSYIDLRVKEKVIYCPRFSACSH